MKIMITAEQLYKLAPNIHDTLSNKLRYAKLTTEVSHGLAAGSPIIAINYGMQAIGSEPPSPDKVVICSVSCSRCWTVVWHAEENAALRVYVVKQLFHTNRVHTFVNMEGNKMYITGETTIEDLVRAGFTDFRLVEPNIPLKENEWRAVSPKLANEKLVAEEDQT